jgi:hypothetical protein
MRKEANVIPSSLSFTLIMEATYSSETSVLTQEPHGFTSQKEALFIVTALKTSDLT